MLVEIDYEPRPEFRAFHHTACRFACIVAHRRCGKTVATINHLIRHILTKVKHKAPRGSYVAPTYSQARDVSWAYFKEFCIGIPGVKFRESDLTITFPNGGLIRLYGAENADRIRGIYNDMAIIDEAADMKPEVWYEIIRPTLADRGGHAVFIGTVKARDIFYDIWRHAEKSDDWFTLSLPVTATNSLTEAEVEDARATLPPNAFAREMMCDWSVEGEDQLISIGDCNGAVDRLDTARANGPILMGVDVARFGDDRSVLIVRNGDTITEIKKFTNLDLMRTASEVYRMQMQYECQRIFVDGIGVGGGVVDRLVHLGLGDLVIDVNSSRTAMDPHVHSNLRAEMWVKMKEWIKTTGSIPDSRELIDDLTGLLYSYDLKNRIKLEGKDDLRKRGLPSPDIADALALTFAEPVSPSDIAHISGLANFEQVGAASGYDEWEEGRPGLRQGYH